LFANTNSCNLLNTSRGPIKIIDPVIITTKLAMLHINISRLGGALLYLQAIRVIIMSIIMNIKARLFID